MEKKQGFFSALKDEVVRSLSPARSRRKAQHRLAHSMSNLPDPLISRSGSLRPVGEALAPLMEGPDGDDGVNGELRREGWGRWVRGQLSRAPSVSGGGGGGCGRSDLRMLLGVMGAPLAPVHVSAGEPLPHLSIKDTPIVSSCKLGF